MKLSNAHFDRFEASLKLKSDCTKDTYSIIVNKFTKFCKGDVTNDNIIDFFNTISRNSAGTSYYAIRFFCESAGIPMTLSLSDVTSKGTIDRVKESMTDDEVAAFIKASKLYYGKYETGLACLSTVYGLRRKEMYNLEEKDFNVKEQWFKVYTLKGGNIRNHLIPAKITGVMDGFLASLRRIRKKPVITSYNALFDDICNKAQITLRPRLGWHSIRRAVVSRFLVENKVSPVVIRDFMRWRMRNADIMFNYVVLDYRNVDNSIFAVHPFLHLWNGDNAMDN